MVARCSLEFHPILRRGAAFASVPLQRHDAGSPIIDQPMIFQESPAQESDVFLAARLQVHPCKLTKKRQAEGRYDQLRKVSVDLDYSSNPADQ